MKANNPAEVFVTAYLSNSGFWKVNKALFNELKCFDTTVFLTELNDRFRYLKQEGRLRDSEWFFYTRESLENTLGLSSARQRVCLKLLRSRNLIETKTGQEMPKRMYYRLCFEQLQKIILQREQELQQKTTTQYENNNN